MIKKILLGLLGVLLVLVIGLLIAARMIGAWHLIFPSHSHESTPPAIPSEMASPAVLVFSKTNAFRHIDGIAGGLTLFEDLSKKHGWGLFATENGAIFNANDLSRFSVVVFNSVSGDVLSEAQEQAFEEWLENGGAWLGIHAAGDDSHGDWPWYVENLIGTRFTAHTMGPQFQVATVHVDDTSHVATQRVPASWQHEEEWYSWEESVRGKGFNVLLTVDESTYDPRMDFLGMERDLRMGDHPVVWSRCLGNGRVLYSALGHRSEAFETNEYQALLEGGMGWLLDETPCNESLLSTLISTTPFSLYR